MIFFKQLQTHNFSVNNHHALLMIIMYSLVRILECTVFFNYKSWVAFKKKHSVL